MSLQYFCAEQSELVSYKTIKVYLAAVRLYHIEHGAPDPTADDLLQLVCRGIRRIQGDNQRTRLPVTVNVMRSLKEQLRQSIFTTHEQRMLWCAFTIAFYGFLRVSEYTNLRWSDVTCSVDHLSITLKQSKTDPFRRGCTIKIFETKSSTCPHRAFKLHRKLSGNPATSAHVFQAGRFHPLSCSAITKTLRKLLRQAGLDDSQYASHSFRIGAATTAAAAGLPEWLIKALGRWSSNAYMTYIHHQPSLSSKLYELLSHTDASSDQCGNQAP